MKLSKTAHYWGLKHGQRKTFYFLITKEIQPILHVKFWDKLYVNTVYYCMTGAIKNLGSSTSITMKKDFD